MESALGGCGKESCHFQVYIEHPISNFPSFFGCNQNNPEVSKNKQHTQSRPWVQRGEIPNISHMKRSGDKLRAGEGGQEEENKIEIGLEIAWKERFCRKGVRGCLFHVSPKQQGTKSTERQGKKNNWALERNVNYVSGAHSKCCVGGVCSCGQAKGRKELQIRKEERWGWKSYVAQKDAAGLGTGWKKSEKMKKRKRNYRER